MARLGRRSLLAAGAAAVLLAAAVVVVVLWPVLGEGCLPVVGGGPSLAGGSFRAYQPPTAPYVGPGGARWELTLDATQALTASRLEGGRWRSVDVSPLSGTTFYGPAAVAADGHALLVTYTSGVVGESVPTHLALGDGRRWRVAGLPHAGGSVSYVDGIALRAGNDGWAVGGELSGGSIQNRYVPPAGPADYHNRPFALHWDGAGWHRTPVPAGEYRLSAVVEVGPDDVWAGGLRTATSAGPTPVMLHWDGSSWSTAGLPTRQGYVDQLVADGADDVWAVLGDSGSGPPLLYRDGTRWSGVALSAPVTPTGAVASCGGLWLAGNDGEGNGELGFGTPDGRWSFRAGPTDGHDRCRTGRLAGAAGVDTLWLQTECSVPGISDYDDVPHASMFG